MNENVDAVYSILDDLEKRVETVRSSAADLALETSNISTTLEIVKGDIKKNQSLSEIDKEDIFTHFDRLSSRLSSIFVKINTIRSPEQELALKETNEMIQSITANLNNLSESELKPLYEKCVLFRNTCDGSGFFHDKFASSYFGCSIEDQKILRNQLYNTVKSLEDKLGSFDSNL